jgi:hypothetical protein
MSELAGSHRQDDRVLRISRPIDPKAFKSGVPPQLAAQIQELHLSIDNDLPGWLDVLSNSCFGLEDLYLNFAKQDETEEEAKMRRLYILYRLPDLQSIDGQIVTEDERQLARPSTPNGKRVNRKEWLPDFDEDETDSQDEEELPISADAVEVSLCGVIKRIHADPPQESFDEPELQKPYQPHNLRSQDSFSQPTSFITTEISEDEEPSPKVKDASGVRLSTKEYSPGYGGLSRFALCARNEKYLAMEESTYEIENPHRIMPENDFPVRCASPDRQAAPKSTPPRLQRPAAPQSPVTRVSPSRSLTSPFPMQFRSRNAAASPKREPAEPDVSTSVEKPFTAHPKPVTAASLYVTMTDMETIDTPSASPALSSSSTARKKQLFKDDRPPPCPGRATSTTPTARSSEDKRQKRILGRWRNRSQIRSTPMMDKDDDTDDEDDDEDVPIAQQSEAQDAGKFTFV